jgi:hypothetical protein
MREYVFTFGYGQLHPETGLGLEHRFVAIRAESAEEARVRMVRYFGQRWGFQYQSREEAGVERHGLRELVRDDWPAPREEERA